jgi:hypothetical protein
MSVGPSTWIGVCGDPLLNIPLRILLDRLGIHENTQTICRLYGGPSYPDHQETVLNEIRFAVEKLGMWQVLLIGHENCRRGTTLPDLKLFALTVLDQFKEEIAEMKIYWFLPEVRDWHILTIEEVLNSMELVQ